jgi:hypothetical protein
MTSELSKKSKISEMSKMIQTSKMSKTSRTYKTGIARCTSANTGASFALAVELFLDG